MPVNLQILLITNVNFALKENGFLISLISELFNHTEPRCRKQRFCTQNPPFVSLCYTKKTHTQSNSKQSQTQLSSAQGNPTPKKKELGS